MAPDGRSSSGGAQHLDEVARTIEGTRPWRWRAVDQDGPVLDIRAPERRGPPAGKWALPHTDHRRHAGLARRAETPDRPVRTPERVDQRLNSLQRAPRFQDPFSAVGTRVRPAAPASCPQSCARSAAPSATSRGERPPPAASSPAASRPERRAT